MKMYYWLTISIFAVLLKENYGSPSIRLLSQRGIIFPAENWDNCFLDEASQQPGLCTNVEDCPEVLSKWQLEQIYPKTCYFIKKEHFVCCPQTASTATATETITVETGRDVTGTSEPYLSELQQPMERRSETECDLNTRVEATIVHGTPTKKDEFPFMAALGWASFLDLPVWYRCGGAVISPKFVLTAAHCADIGGEAASVVRVGGSNLTDGSVRDIKIKRFIKHPDYVSTSVYNDIALVELEEEATDVYAACLATEDELISDNVIAVGYGHTEFAGAGSDQLLKINLKVVPNAECARSYPSSSDAAPNGIVNSHLCAGDPEGLRDTCQGDSGGPLVLQKGTGRYVRGYIAGVTSYGLGCAGGTPGIYSRVSSHLDWIEDTVWPTTGTRFRSV